MKLSCDVHLLNPLAKVPRRPQCKSRARRQAAKMLENRCITPGKRCSDQVRPGNFCPARFVRLFEEIQCRVAKGAGTASNTNKDSRAPCPPSALTRVALSLVGTAHARLSSLNSRANAQSPSKTGVNALMAHPTADRLMILTRTIPQKSKRTADRSRRANARKLVSPYYFFLAGA